MYESEKTSYEPIRNYWSIDEMMRINLSIHQPFNKFPWNHGKANKMENILHIQENYLKVWYCICNLILYKKVEYLDISVLGLELTKILFPEYRIWLENDIHVHVAVLLWIFFYEVISFLSLSIHSRKTSIICSIIAIDNERGWNSSRMYISLDNFQ